MQTILATAVALVVNPSTTTPPPEHDPVRRRATPARSSHVDEAPP